VLERVFEVEMHSRVEGDWQETAVANHIRLRDPYGNLRDPSDVVNDVISAIVQLKDENTRRQLEYVLLGGAVPLEDRRLFEAYCVQQPQSLEKR
jgi:hypothetical protein